MPPTPLDDATIRTRLASRPGWTLDKGQITRTFVAPSFAAGIARVVAVGFAAEKADHHPEITIRYTRITFALSTHDAKGITERDFALAAQIDAIFG